MMQRGGRRQVITTLFALNPEQVVSVIKLFLGKILEVKFPQNKVLEETNASIKIYEQNLVQTS